MGQVGQGLHVGKWGERARGARGATGAGFLFGVLKWLVWNLRSRKRLAILAGSPVVGNVFGC